MKFLPYEDVPLFLAINGKEGEHIFAESVTLSIDNNLSPNRQIDDNLIQICEFGSGSNMQYVSPTFAIGTNYTATMGPTDGPPRPIATSIHKIPADTKVTFPNGKHLYFANDIHPDGQDYLVNFYTLSGNWQLSAEEAQQGYFEPLFNYSQTQAVQGNLNVNFYLNTGNLQNFFDITGLSDLTAYPPIDEEKITGYFGDFTFSDAYLNSLSFSLSPNSISQASASFMVFGNLSKNENISRDYYSSDLYQQQSIAHGETSKIIGHTDLGMNHPISFSYSIQTSRTLKYVCPIDKNDNAGLVPVRVSKDSTIIDMSIEGDNLSPDIISEGPNGSRANLKAILSDLNYDNFEDNSNGFMHEFNCNGAVVSKSLSINSQGYLNGSISVRQQYT